MQAITCAQTAYLSHLLTTRSAHLHHTSALQHNQLSANFAVYVKRQYQISFAIPISIISLVICIFCPDTTTCLFAYSEQMQRILFGKLRSYATTCLFTYSEQMQRIPSSKLRSYATTCLFAYSEQMLALMLGLLWG